MQCKDDSSESVMYKRFMNSGHNYHQNKGLNVISYKHHEDSHNLEDVSEG